MRLNRHRQQREAEVARGVDPNANAAGTPAPDPVPVTLWISDAEGSRIYLGREWHGLARARPGEESGNGWLEAIHRDDRAEVATRLEQATARQQAFSVEYRLRTETGDYRWMLDSGRPRYALDGTFLGLAGTVLDVTGRRETLEALRKSERRYRQLVSLLPVAVFACDAKGQLQYCNTRAVSLWGREPKLNCSEELYCGSHRLYYPDGAPMSRDECPMSQAVRRGQSFREKELIIEQPTGVRVLVSVNIDPLLDEDENIVGAVSVFQDVTARKRTEEELRTLTEELERRVRERTAVAEQRARQLQAVTLQLTEAEERERRRLAGVLHDGLQQSLVAARLSASLIKTRLESRAALLELAAELDAILAQCIQESRTLSHELVPSILYETGLCAALKWLARHVKEKHGLAVRVTAGEEPLLSDLTRSFLFQSVRELLFNVVKHAGVMEAWISAGNDEQGWRLEVADGGQGFNVANAMGVDVDRGFGLCAIRERIGLMDGEMEIHSEPGKGTRIILRVPLESTAIRSQQAINPVMLEETPPREGTSGAATEPGMIRVLLVDDHRVMRSGLESLLEEEDDIEVIAGASNGLEAVDCARRLKPDVILMDVSMPEMDGVEATRVISAEFPEIRIIGLSMHEEADMAHRMLEAGAAAYFSKGGAPDMLIDAIRDLEATPLR